MNHVQLSLLSLKNNKHEGEQLIISVDPYNQHCPSMYITQVGTAYTNYWSAVAESFDRSNDQNTCWNWRIRRSSLLKTWQWSPILSQHITFMYANNMLYDITQSPNELAIALCFASQSILYEQKYGLSLGWLWHVKQTLGSISLHLPMAWL